MNRKENSNQNFVVQNASTKLSEWRMVCYKMAIPIEELLEHVFINTNEIEIREHLIDLINDKEEN